MKKLYLALLAATSHFCVLYSQQPPRVNFQPPDISSIEKQAHQRLRDITGIAGTDTFTVATDNIDVNHYRCEWSINPSARYISGKITVSFTVTTQADRIVLDLANAFTVDSILYHGNTIPFQRIQKDGVQIQLPATLSVAKKDSISIFYQGVPDPTYTGVVFQGYHRYSDALWTLSEPYGSKLWWACKNVLTDKADSIDILVTHPSDYIVSTNGVKIAESISGSVQTTHFKHRYPIASYLVAILVARYTVATDSVQIGNRMMPVLMYSYPVHVGYFTEATRVAKLCLPKFSELFGIYPFYQEQYSQTYWAVHGGMEHQTNSFIGDRNSNLISHELGHQWFGDKVTCGSWQDLWLNEGFATYSTNIYYEHYEKSIFKTTLQNQINNITSQPGGSVWVDDTANVGRLFSGRLTYNKGSYVVHMLRWILGDSVFFKGVRRYLDDPAVRYSFARTTDLRKALEAESGKNLESFFQKWIYGEGYPDYQADWSQNNNKWIKLKLNQTTSHSSVTFYEMPVTIVAKGGTQEQKFVVDHRQNGQEFWLDAGFVVDTIMIDPDLWILSKVKTSRKINTSTTPDEIKVFPNPAPDDVKISIKNPSSKKLSVQLMNALGQVVVIKNILTPGRDELINISLRHLPQGIYWLKVGNEGNIEMIKKIVHRR